LKATNGKWKSSSGQFSDMAPQKLLEGKVAIITGAASGESDRDMYSISGYINI